MLDSHPGLLGHENFSISEMVSAENEQHYLFYMHSGSEVTVSACFVDSAAIVPLTGFYIVKGIHGYNGLYIMRSDIKSIVAKFALYHDCQNSGKPFAYTMEDDDYYYFVFHTSTLGNPLLNLNVNMSFYSTHYSLYNTTVNSSCTLLTSRYGSTCSLHVHGSTGFALLTIHPVSSDVDWLDEIPLETYCEPYLWVYIPPPLLLMGLTLVCTGVCCCGYKVKTNRKFTSCYRKFTCCYRKFTSYYNRVRKEVLVYYLSSVIILTSTIVGLHFKKGTSYSNDGQSYGPTDTRLIPFSNTFCQSLSLQTNFNDSDEYNISFYMLSSQPQLSEI